MILNPSQISIIESELNTSISLSGPAGSGKTTAGIGRLKYLAQQKASGREILLFFPQRNLGSPYQESITSLEFPGNSLPVSVTYGGLARRNIDLFWPQLMEEFPYFSLHTPPIFLTLESTLYFLSRIVEPLILEQGLFSSVTIQRNRLYSQILDNLNKAAVNGFPHTDISEKLKSSWIGDSVQEKIFDDAQLSANLFREYCLENNLLDFSLQVELFTLMLSESSLVKSHIQKQFSHLIYDNIEEDVPVAHDFVKFLLPSLDSALLITDKDAGFRHFLGASPESARKLVDLCQIKTEFSKILTSPNELLDFNNHLQSALNQRSLSKPEIIGDIQKYVTITYQPYLPQMAGWVAGQISTLLENGTSPDEIVVLAPFLSDSLRFLLTTELQKRSISVSTHRPSRALRDEPTTHCLLTLATLAHPEWKILPSVHELALCLMQVFGDLDLTRAFILSKQALSNREPTDPICDFDSMPGEIQERITFFAGKKYQIIKAWLDDYQSEPVLPLDHFLIRIFGELLSQPGYGFHNDFSKSEITDRVIDSIRKFRQSAGLVFELDNLGLGAEYYKMVKTGVLANQYLRSWTKRPSDHVHLAPAYTFLLSNYPVEYQFWLDVGSRGWYERIYQPLTNPHVLQRYWDPESVWRDSEEHSQNIKSLANLTTGLIRRCKNGIFFCITDTDERGFEQNGLLIQALNRVIMASTPGPGNSKLLV